VRRQFLISESEELGRKFRPGSFVFVPEEYVGIFPLLRLHPFDPLLQI
jgi:hypothetical protein